MPTLIGSVTVTPPQVVPGESVRVQVLDPNGKPYAADSNVAIALDGVPVSSRYYQFATEGSRTISVRAVGNGTTETATAVVNVTGAPLFYRRTIFPPGQPAAPGQLPFLVLDQNLSTPYQARFSLAMPPAANAAAARLVAAAAKANAGKPVPAAVQQTPPDAFVALQALFARSPAGAVTARTTTPGTLGGVTLHESTQFMVLQTPLKLAEPATSYLWDFGDGQTATTRTPSVVHDYFGSIVPGRVPFAFDVSCRIVHDNITVTRTLVMFSAYGMCQRNGTTVPHVEGDVFATLNSDKSSFAASFLVYNIEATTMTIDQMAIVPVSDDAGAAFPAYVLKKMAQPITIAPHSSSLLALHVLRSDLQNAANGLAITGFMVAFRGTLAAPALPPPMRGPVGAGRLVAPQLAGGNLLGGLNQGIGGIGLARAQIVRFSRHVRLRLQDQQLPAPQVVVFRPPQTVLQALPNVYKVADPVVRSGALSIDPSTAVVSVALSAQVPTPNQVAQVRHSVLSILNAATAAGATS